MRVRAEASWWSWSAERCHGISRVGIILQNWKPEITEHYCFPKNKMYILYIYLFSIVLLSAFCIWDLDKISLIQKTIIKNKGNFEVMNTNSNLLTCGKCTWFEVKQITSTSLTGILMRWWFRKEKWKTPREERPYSTYCHCVSLSHLIPSQTCMFWGVLNYYRRGAKGCTDS